MTIQESSNSTVSISKVGEQVQAVLNISGLQIITVIISSDNSLTGNSYDIYVSNNGHTWYYLRSVQCTGNFTSNSFTVDNQSVFGNILSFNHVKIALAGVADTIIQAIVSGR